jgi:predicted component of viral defense system (DUF524 family)
MEGGYDMILVPPANGRDGTGILLCASATKVMLDPALCEERPELPQGWKARPWHGNGPAPIRLKQWSDTTTIRLLENRPYEWVLCGGPPDATVRSSLQDADKQRWSEKHRPGIPAEGSFTVTNHLGHARLEVCHAGQVSTRVLLEICSTKLDHDVEYRAMTEDIAAFCSALLMRWQAPTGLRFASNAADHARTLIERFFFLRHELHLERARALLGMITRNPHRTLRSELEWKPASLAASPHWLGDPAHNATGWHRNANGKLQPEHVRDIRKEESVDTAPNRFILHALGTFRRLCEEVVGVCGAESTVGLEAAELRDGLSALESGYFFRDVGRMIRLPLENQTLQKRAGYRDILRTWLLCEAASTIDWSGLEDTHHGDSKDAALLYEYWVFIKLQQLIEKLPGMTVIEGGNSSLDFIGSTADGCVEIRLKSGKQSRRCFHYRRGEDEMIVELHYEREFRGKAPTTAAGSYSRIFRPDYTLSIRPSSFVTETDALAMGKLAFLHFDAKYRLHRTTDIIGDEEMDDESLASEKALEKSTRVHNRADLLKMHTYNDAVRMTIGSYVLYPGDTHTSLPRFYEVAPGVGAYAMKPGNDACLTALGNFIRDILEHQCDKFTQYRYLADHQHRTVISEPESFAEDTTSYKVAQPDSNCVLLWMDDRRARVFREKGFAYCHAVPENIERRLEMEISVEIGSELIPYGGARSEHAHTRDWRAKIRSAKFLTRQKLTEYLTGKVPKDWSMPQTATHYLLFEFDEVSSFARKDIDFLARGNQQGSRFMAFTCKWRELLEA